MSPSSRQQQILGVIVVAIFGSTVGAQQAAQRPNLQQQELAREAWQKVPEIFAAMGVRPGAVVADVGAGDGFLTARLAGAVGRDGRVFAVDADERAVERLRARVQQDALTNVTVIKGDPFDPHLSPASIDAAVILNAYHEMVEHQAMLQRLRIALKPEGRLVIVEPVTDRRWNDRRAQQTKEHEIGAWFVEQEAREAGFRIQLLQDPFTRRGPVMEWLIVGVPDPSAATDITDPAAAASPTAPPSDDAEEASPDLRIAFEAFKQRRAGGSIVVVDVRSEEEYLEGHIPGALWIELSSLSTHLAQLKSLQKPIVTYCS